MAEEKDPFELLKSKLEARKKQKEAAPAPNPPAAGAAPPGPPASKPRAVRPVARSAPPPPAARPAASQAPPAVSAGGAPRGLVKSSWAAEDLKKMKNSREQVGGEAPSRFVSHRFDSDLDARNRKRKETEKGAAPLDKPKRFKSDRFDR